MRGFVCEIVLVVLVLVGGIQSDEKDVSTVDNAMRRTGDESSLSMHGISSATEQHMRQKRQLGGFVSSSAQTQTNSAIHRPGILGLGLGSRVANSGVNSILGRVSGGRLGESVVNSASHGVQLGRGGATGISGLISASGQANAVNHGPGILGLGLGSRVASSGATSILGRLPGGRLGVNAANSAAQGLQLGPGGLTGAAAQSASQSLSLGSRRINIAHSNGFSIENGRPRLSRGSSLTIA